MGLYRSALFCAYVDGGDLGLMEIHDYYEFLQISPNADADTVHRVYRFLAARYHPDNPETADAEKFFLLTQAYSVLSSPERRADYDAKRKNGAVHPAPLSSSIDFMDNVKGELNRRLAVLAVLYFQRRANPYSPEVSFLDIEVRLGFPREYLEFTAWYLRNKGYIVRADNSDFTLTVEGVDFVETQRVNIPLLNKLLTMGEGHFATDAADLSHASRNFSLSAMEDAPNRVDAQTDSDVSENENLTS
jgi:curved DNA-binding protein CbpA